MSPNLCRSTSAEVIPIKVVSGLTPFKSCRRTLSETSSIVSGTIDRREDVEDLSDADLLRLAFRNNGPSTAVDRVAIALTNRFGCLSRIVCADAAELVTVSGVTSDMVDILRLHRTMGIALAKAPLRDESLLEVWDDFLHYLNVTFSGRRVESASCFFLDAQGRLVSEDEISSGTIDAVAIYPREIMRKAIQYDAKTLILVHNHPSGDPTPSDLDIRMSQLLTDVAHTFDMSLYDSIIVGAGRQVSLRDTGML